MSRNGVWLAAAVLLTAGCGESVTEVVPEVTYSFTSGPASSGGDGFDWPTSMIDDTPSSIFETPHGVQFFHDIENTLFFDDDYLLPDEAAGGTGIVAEAMWGSPRTSIDNNMVETVNVNFQVPAVSVAFDVAWAVGPDSIVVGVTDDFSETGEFVTYSLPNSFPSGPVYPGFGRSGRIEISIASLAARGIAFDVIRRVVIFVDEIADDGSAKAFAVDNFFVRFAM